MAVEIDQSPEDLMPSDWAFHPEIGPFMRAVLNRQTQTKERVGGDVDIIEEVTYETIESESHKYYDIRALKKQNDAFKAQLETMRATTSDSSISALKAELITQRRLTHQLKQRLEAFIAEVQTNA
jgi:hypothetical protein